MDRQAYMHTQVMSCYIGYVCSLLCGLYAILLLETLHLSQFTESLTGQVCWSAAAVHGSCQIKIFAKRQ
jgi:hypothetical protein